MSNLELDFFHIIEWSTHVVDIREQFPLLPVQETVAIAEALGIRHPTDTRTKRPTVLTTDFLITVLGDPRNTEEARTIKPASELQSSRTLEKLEVERNYWSARNVDWAVVTDADISQIVARNLWWLHPYVRIPQMETLPEHSLKKIDRMLRELLDRGLGLAAAAHACDGLFLSESRRMHPSVCRFISESIYEGRLGSDPDCARQKIVLSPGANNLITKGTGIVFSGVEHDGDIQQSDEEVERVQAIYDELLGRLYTTKDGSTRPLSLEDFLFIAPYNAQVRALQRTLPATARRGSVDKFQGQQAPVCILSLCSSFGEYDSRGLAFILDRNRINVAISRAQCLAVIVADPRIAGAAAGSIDEMKLLNLFCKLVKSGSN